MRKDSSRGQEGHVGLPSGDDDVWIDGSWYPPDDPDFDGEDFDEPLTFAPVLLPTAAELMVAAEGSTMVRQVQALLIWLNDGKPLGGPHKLRPTDLQSLAVAMDLEIEYEAGSAWRQVTLALEWSRAAGLVKTVKGRLLPTKASGTLRRKPLELWERLFGKFEQLGPQFVSRARREPLESEFAEGFEEVWDNLMIGLYQDADMPVPLELLDEIAGEVVEFVNPFAVRGPRTSPRHPVIRRGTGQALGALERLGAVEVTEANPDELEAIKAATGSSAPDIRLVRLTPIGVWAAHRVLAGAGAYVLEVRQVADLPVAEVARRLGQASVDAAGVGWAAWVAARGEIAAAAQLEQALCEADSAALRLALTAGLTQAGRAGQVAALRLRSKGGLPGVLLTGFLIEQGVIDPESVTAEEAILAMTDVLVAALDDGAMIEMLSEGSVPDQIDMLRGIARSGHPDALRILDEVVDGHPERKVSRAAVKERMRLRTSGTG